MNDPFTHHSSRCRRASHTCRARTKLYSTSERDRAVTFLLFMPTLCLFCLFCDFALEVFSLFSSRASVYGDRARRTASYNVTGTRLCMFTAKVFAMWYIWSLVLASAALVQANPTTRAPLRTLDRKASELAWRSWLQSPEQSNQNTPPRRITTKSLFITPLVCPKGQRLERDACVQVLTVNKDEHTAILLEELQKLFTAPPSEIQYDYGDVFEEQQGPVQVSIPIGIDPQAQPLQAQDNMPQAQEVRPDYIKTDKKGENPVFDASIKAELELHQLPQANDPGNFTESSESMGILNHNVLNNNFLPLVDKPKRDSPIMNSSEENLTTNEKKDEGQKEVVYGQVNVDPILYHVEETSEVPTTTDPETEIPTTIEVDIDTATPEIITTNQQNITMHNFSNAHAPDTVQTLPVLKSEQTKLNPENDYADIGEAIKLISRYAAVTTDDNFSKDQKKYAYVDDDILGTRTKQQYRRNKPKSEQPLPLAYQKSGFPTQPEPVRVVPRPVYYRYSWGSPRTPPPGFPYRRLQDYWPSWRQTGGVHSLGRENPTRHHHAYPHGLRPRAYLPPATRPRTNNQDLYSLLGLRHWISSEAASKR